MPPNLVALFAHVMSRANEGVRGSGSRAHSWEEVLQPASSAGSTSPGPFPMSAQDWRKAEAFSVQLQSLLTTRQSRCTSNGHSRAAGHYANGVASVCSSPFAAASAQSDESQTESSSSAISTVASSEGESVSHANGKVKGRAKPTEMYAAPAGASGAPPAASSAFSPNQATAWSRHHAPRVTPKEPSRAAEPSAPTKVVGRVAASRRVNGSADGAVASLEVSHPVPGAFETPSHPSHLAAPPGAPTGGNPRGRDTSPSRYPARLRSRRFPQLGGTVESPELPQPRGLGQGAGAYSVDEGDQSHGARRLSPRNSHASLARGEHPQDWLGATRAGASAHEHGHDARDVGVGQRDGVTTRAAPKAAHDLESAKGALCGSDTSHAGVGAVGSPATMEFRPAPPPIMGSTAASCESNPRPEITARPRQVLQGGRSVGRATLIPRSSVGGRNYTDNQVKQLRSLKPRSSPARPQGTVQCTTSPGRGERSRLPTYSNLWRCVGRAPCTGLRPKSRSRRTLGVIRTSSTARSMRALLAPLGRTSTTRLLRSRESSPRFSCPWWQKVTTVCLERLKQVLPPAQIIVCSRNSVTTSP